MKEITDMVEAPCIIEPKTCYCGGALKPLVTGPFFVYQNGTRVNLRTTLYYCKICDLSIRGLNADDPMVSTHYELALYTDPEKEAYWRERRKKFFNWFYQMALRHSGHRPEVVLDFGCSYGHLLDIFADGGAHTIGIEISPQMVQRIKREWRHQVYSTVEDTNIADDSVDLIVAIDSIYCCGGSDPTELLATFCRKLRRGGILIARITNRNQIHRFYAFRWHVLHGRFCVPAPIPYRICGDAMLNFSERALISRFPHAGLRKVAAYRWERKRKRPLEYVRDAAVLVAYYVSAGRIDICPGLVIVAEK